MSRTQINQRNDTATHVHHIARSPSGNPCGCQTAAPPPQLVNDYRRSVGGLTRPLGPIVIILAICCLSAAGAAPPPLTSTSRPALSRSTNMQRFLVPVVPAPPFCKKDNRSFKAPPKPAVIDRRRGRRAPTVPDQSPARRRLGRSGRGSPRKTRARAPPRCRRGSPRRPD